ncbi:MAG: hypothetical protein DWQ06_07185 [Calditrichaeota bacterium]|nr:MAG: hypothetical protein DWQ06_07185 [Calditrichota bacterium]
MKLKNLFTNAELRRQKSGVRSWFSERLKTFDKTAKIELRTLVRSYSTNGLKSAIPILNLLVCFSSLLTAKEKQEFAVTSQRPVEFGFEQETILATFSEKVDTSTISKETFFILKDSREIEGKISFSRNFQAVTFSPTGKFLKGAKITCILTNGIKSKSGKSLQPKLWEFVVRGKKNLIPQENELVIYSSDLDFDGNLDIVLADNSALWENILVFWGFGDGAFSVPLRLSFPGKAFKILTENLDETPFAEIIVTGREFGKVAVFKNNFDSFGEPQIFNGIRFALPNAEDLDKDGDKDLILVSEEFSQNVKVLLNDGKGNFSTNPLESEKILSAYAGDLNSDGIPDLAGITDSEEKFLQLKISSPKGYNSSKLRIGNFSKISANDFNNDAKPDLFLFKESGEFEVFLNSGDGSFLEQENYFLQTKIEEVSDSPKSSYKILDSSKNEKMKTKIEFLEEKVTVEVFDFSGKKLSSEIFEGKKGDLLNFERKLNFKQRVFLKIIGGK